MKLDEMRSNVDAKYEALLIDVDDTHVVELMNAIRLPKDKRTKMMALQGELKNEGADQAALLSEMIRLAAKTKAQADMLLKAVGDDLPLLLEIVKEYGKKTQVGEASGSQE